MDGKYCGQEIKLVFTGKPLSVNKTYKTKRGTSNMYLSQEAKSYGDMVGWEARKQYRGLPLRDELEVVYNYYFNDFKRRDHLNYNKLLNDRLNQIVWKDDKQIKISHHYTFYDKQNPRIELFIKRLSVYA